jgi:hypothetical protein
LAGVLDHRNASRLCDREQARHVHHGAGHMHGNDRLGARRDGRFQVRDIHTEIVLAIDELCHRTGIGNRSDRRNEGVGRGDDLVAWSNTECLQPKAERIRPGIHAERVVNTGGLRKPRFEFLDRFAEREVTGCDHLPQTREDRFRVSELLGQV